MLKINNNNYLEITDLSVSYGGIEAVKQISMSVPRGKIVTLIGSNGAGKSTTLRTIAGVVRAKSGSIKFDGEEICGKTPDSIVSMGITLVPEGRRVFDNLTVLENLKIGAYIHNHKLDDDIAMVYDLFPRLKQFGGLAHGPFCGTVLQRLCFSGLALHAAMLAYPHLYTGNIA